LTVILFDKEIHIFIFTTREKHYIISSKETTNHVFLHESGWLT